MSERRGAFPAGGRAAAAGWRRRRAAAASAPGCMGIFGACVGAPASARAWICVRAPAVAGGRLLAEIPRPRRSVP